MHETVCWLRSYRLKLEREYILEWLFTQLVKHVTHTHTHTQLKTFRSGRAEFFLFPLKSKDIMSQ